MLNSTVRTARALLAALGIAVAIAATVPAAAEPAPMSAAERAAMENLVRDYIMENPEVILESIRAFQERQRAAEEAARRERLVDLRPQLQNAETSPVGGNPAGDVTLVEFFDYRCGYCKRVHGPVTEAIAADGEVRLVYKEFPILGPESVFAARAALGVFFTQPDKYVAFHDAMMTSRGNLTNDKVMDLAASVGLDPARVEAAMTDSRVEREIQHNLALAQSLGISGTPAFVIADQLVPGAIDRATLEQLIARARGG